MADKLKLEDLQSFEDPAFASAPTPRQTENRRSVRKVFEAQGSLRLDNGVLDFKTLDISANGLSLELKHQLAVGAEGRIGIDALVAGQPTTIAATVRIVYCFHCGDQTYKAGVAFLDFSTGIEHLEALLRD